MAQTAQFAQRAQFRRSFPVPAGRSANRKPAPLPDSLPLTALQQHPSASVESRERRNFHFTRKRPADWAGRFFQTGKG
jgi:hypothetical protein